MSSVQDPVSTSRFPMQAEGFMNRLRRFDAYPKTLEDFRVKTFGGAAVTLVSGAIMVLLFVSELGYYLQTDVTPELFVDTNLSIDAMDVSGEHQLDVDHHILKKRLDEDGNPLQEVPAERHTELGEDKDKTKEFIETVAGKAKEQKEEEKAGEETCGSCYGAETEKLMCCNTCEDVREAYRQKGWAFNNAIEIAQCKEEGWSDKIKSQQKEGCVVFGYLEVNKVAGNFHFAPGKSFQQHHVHVHDLQPFGMKSFNLTHTIHQLSFGQQYPGIDNPLEGVSQVDTGGSTMFQYFVKVVPTVYKKLNGKVIKTNQYSATKHQKSIGITMPATQQGLPGVFVLYDLSPMMVQITETRRSFMHFLTGVCAIVGGVFTVASLIDAMIYHSVRSLQQKIELGKHS